MKYNISILQPLLVMSVKWSICMMDPTCIYYNNLTFDDEKKFSTDFSDEDSLESVVFKKNKIKTIK